MPAKSIRCPVCQTPIPTERVKFLQESGFDANELFCVKHSPIKPKQGIYLGEPGTSDLLYVKKVYDDSVGSVFADDSSEEETGPEE